MDNSLEIVVLLDELMKLFLYYIELLIPFILKYYGYKQEKTIPRLLLTDDVTSSQEHFLV